MAGDAAKFIVEFKAEIKELNKALQKVKQDVKEINKGSSKTQKESQKYYKETARNAAKDRRTKKFENDAELKHLKNVNALKRTGDRTASQERIRGMKEEARQYKRLRDRGELPGGKQGGGAWSKINSRQGTWGKINTYGGNLIAGAGLGALGMLISAASAGYQKYNEMRVARARSIGLGAAGGGNQDVLAGLRGANRGKGSAGALGYSSIDVANMMPIMARATGSFNVRDLLQGQRASGMEAGEVGDIYGTLRRSGYSFQGQKGGSAGANAFKKLMAGAVESGLESARKGEFIEGVKNIAEQQRNILTGNIDTTKIAAALAMWGKSGQPGLQGAAGANLYSQVAGAVMKPGGGEWGQAFMNQAMGFGLPGGKTNFYDAEKRRETAGSDPGVVMDVMKMFKTQFGGFGGQGKEESSLAMREALGITLHQAEELQKIYESDKDAAKKQEEIQKVMDQSKSLEQQSLDAMKGLGGGVQRLADLTNKSIAIGAKAAPYIEKMEDWQHQLLQYIIGIAENIAAIAQVVKDVWGAKSTKDVTADQTDKMGELRKNLLKAKTEDERNAIMKQIEGRASYARAGVEVQAEDAGTLMGQLFGPDKAELMDQMSGINNQTKGAREQMQRQQLLEQLAKNKLLPKGMTQEQQNDFAYTGVAPAGMNRSMELLRDKQKGITLSGGGMQVAKGDKNLGTLSTDASGNAVVLHKVEVNQRTPTDARKPTDKTVTGGTDVMKSTR